MRQGLVEQGGCIVSKRVAILSGLMVPVSRSIYSHMDIQSLKRLRVALVP